MVSAGCFKQNMADPRPQSLGIVILALLYATTAFKVKAADIESVCTYVVETMHLYGGKLLRLDLDPSCEDFKGIGEDILRNDAQGQDCYSKISSKLCGMQYMDYEASPSCEESLSLFWTLLPKCKANVITASKFASCAGYSREEDVIFDPGRFCQSSFFRSESSDSGMKISTFAKSPTQDCERIAENYNACKLTARDLLGYSPSYCLGSGYSAYCKKYPVVVKDPSFRSICKNIVVPYVIEFTRLGVNPRSKSFCSGLFPNFLVFLAAKNGDFIHKAQAAKEGIRSMQRLDGVGKSARIAAESSEEISNSVARESTVVLTVLRKGSISGRLFNRVVVDRFTNLKFKVSGLQNLITDWTCSDSSGNREEDLRYILSVQTKVDNLIEQQKEVLEAIRKLKSKTSERGSFSFHGAPGFVALKSTAIETLLAAVNVSHDSILKKISCFRTYLNGPEQDVNQQDISDLAESGGRFINLSDIYGRQIKFLQSAQQNESNQDSTKKQPP